MTRIIRHDAEPDYWETRVRLFEYDEAGRMQAIEERFWDGGYEVDTMRTSFTHDAEGRLIEESIDGSYGGEYDTIDGNPNIVTRYTYEGLQVTGVRAWHDPHDGQPSQQTTVWVFDELGALLTREEELTGDYTDHTLRTYLYDCLPSD